MTESEKRRNCLLYDAFDPELSEEQRFTHRLCEEYNHLGVDGAKRKEEILRELFPEDDFGRYRVMEAPIFIDNIHELRIGKNFYSNVYFSYIGGGCASIGDNVFIGPFCTLACGMHALLPDERNIHIDEDGSAHDYEYGLPIQIGNNVWIASNVTILGGVKIGDNSVIGAGSVVTKDVPEGVLAAGNPCRVIRKITKADRLKKK